MNAKMPIFIRVSFLLFSITGAYFATPKGAEGQIGDSIAGVQLGDWVDITGPCSTYQGYKPRCRRTGAVAQVTSDRIAIRRNDGGPAETFESNFIRRLRIFRGEYSHDSPPSSRLPTDAIPFQMLGSAALQFALLRPSFALSYVSWSWFPLAVGTISGSSIPVFLVGRLSNPGRGSLFSTVLGSTSGYFAWRALGLVRIANDADYFSFWFSYFALPMVGGIIGYQLSAKLSPEDNPWKEIPLDRFRVQAGPGIDGGLSFSMNVSF